MYVGVDPAIRTLAIACVKPLPGGEGKFEVLGCSTTRLDTGVGIRLEAQILAAVAGVVPDFSQVLRIALERYVPYDGVVSPHSETILCVIGMIRYLFWQARPDVDISLFRAIEWKTELVQIISSKYGFKHTSEKLDKTFSLAAARFLTNNNKAIKNDHIADAICIAALPFLREESRRSKEKTAKSGATTPSRGFNFFTL